MTNEELVRNYYNGDESALNELFLRTGEFLKPLAITAAKTFNCYKYEKDSKKLSNYTFGILEELICIGDTTIFYLLKNRSYDPEQAQLATYAKKFIKGAMHRFLEKNIGVFSLSKEEMGKIRKAQKLHYDGISQNEIAEMLNIKNTLVSEYIQYNTHFLSVYDLVPNDCDDDPFDYLMIEDLSTSVDEVVYRKICVELLEELFHSLSAKDKLVLGHYDGVFEYKKEQISHDELAERLELSDDGLRKARNTAIEHLREKYKTSTLRMWRIIHRVVMDEARKGPRGYYGFESKNEADIISEE